MTALAPYADERRRLTRTDPDPRVRHRADALLLAVAETDAEGLMKPGPGTRFKTPEPVWVAANCYGCAT